MLIHFLPSSPFIPFIHRMLLYRHVKSVSFVKVSNWVSTSTRCFGRTEDDVSPWQPTHNLFRCSQTVCKHTLTCHLLVCEWGNGKVGRDFWIPQYIRSLLDSAHSSGRLQTHEAWQTEFQKTKDIQNMIKLNCCGYQKLVLQLGNILEKGYINQMLDLPGDQTNQQALI